MKIPLALWMWVFDLVKDLLDFLSYPKTAGSRPRDLHLFNTGTLLTAIYSSSLKLGTSIKLYDAWADDIRYEERV